MYLSRDLLSYAGTSLVGSLRGPPQHPLLGYSSNRGTPTPFDHLIEREKEQWKTDNAPFRVRKPMEGVAIDELDDSRETPPESGLPLESSVSASSSDLNAYTLRQHGFYNPAIVSRLLHHQGLSETQQHQLQTFGFPVTDSSIVQEDGQPNDGSPDAKTTARAPRKYPHEPLSLLTPVNRPYLSRFSLEGPGHRRAGANIASENAEVDPCILLPSQAPIRFNRGDGRWCSGYWIEPLAGLSLHWFDPSRDQTALLEHVGPILVRTVEGDLHLVVPKESGIVYIAVPPTIQVKVLSLSQPVELAEVFERMRPHPTA